MIKYINTYDHIYICMYDYMYDYILIGLYLKDYIYR